MTGGYRNLIGKRLEAQCARRGWSAYMLSCASGVPLTTILHIFDGSTKNPGIYTVLRLCRAMDIGLGELVGDAEED
ncbi:MAG: XRE family transcriptional regulator [Eubacteriales bacterium]|nr:XRE family transcriptional regulator [Eubacteriales bacterium]